MTERRDRTEKQAEEVVLRKMAKDMDDLRHHTDLNNPDEIEILKDEIKWQKTQDGFDVEEWRIGNLEKKRKK